MSKAMVAQEKKTFLLTASNLIEEKAATMIVSQLEKRAEETLANMPVYVRLAITAGIIVAGAIWQRIEARQETSTAQA